MPVEIKTSVLGTHAAVESIQDLGGETRNRVRRTLAALGEELRSAAASKAPRRTGALARSIKARLNETSKQITEVIQPGKFYANFVEKGVVNYGQRRPNNKRAGSHSSKKAIAYMHALRREGAWRVKPRPFLGPAMEQLEPRVRQALEQAVKGG